MDPAGPPAPAGGEPRYRSKGQLAMAAAMGLSLEPNKSTGGRPDTGVTRAAKASGVSQPRLSQALLVRKYASQLAQEVIDGQLPLDQAYALAQEARARLELSDRPGSPNQSAPSDQSGSSDHLEPIPAVPPSLVLRPKRNSGRTGPKRLTAAEVAQRDQHAAADHRRRLYADVLRQALS